MVDKLRRYEKIDFLGEGQVRLKFLFSRFSLTTGVSNTVILFFFITISLQQFTKPKIR